MSQRYCLITAFTLLVHFSVALGVQADPATEPESGIEQNSQILGGQANEYCGGCHGVSASVGVFAPDLARLALEREPLDFVRVLLHGKFDRGGSQMGHLIPVMPQLDSLSNSQIAAVVNELYEQVAEKRRAAERSTIPISAQDVELQRYLSSPAEAPGSLDAAEYARATELYFEHCAGCHGVNREGGGGSSLYGWEIAMRGASEVAAIVHEGTTVGMPGWSAREELSNSDMALLAQFLLLPAPPPPTFPIERIRQTWQEIVSPEARPVRRRFPFRARDLFVSLIHNPGRVLLIDGRSKRVVGEVDLHLAPHEVDVSADGRYLYVMSRGAQISLIDLYMREPAVVASVRIALEGRSFSIGGTLGEPILVAGGYWPPQYVVLEAETLRPLHAQLVDNKAHRQGLSARELTQVIASAESNRFVLVTKAEGTIHALDLGDGDSPEPILTRGVEGGSFLRAGSFDLSGRYLLVPGGSR